MTVGLRALGLEGIRNLADTRIEIGPDILIGGRNGAGKTAILEAVYVLARGRTFRSARAGPVLARGRTQARILGKLNAQDPIDATVGEGPSLEFRLDGRESRRWINGLEWRGSDPAASPLRVKLIGANAQALVEGGPALRRQLLDWNVFHVEHGYGAGRREFDRALLQRNAALRSDPRQLAVWDRPFIELSETLTAWRRRFVQDWDREFRDLARVFPATTGLELHLRLEQGWREGFDLGAAIESVSASELARGQTLVGPSRADLQILMDGASATLSRGQAKAVVVLMQIAAETVHQAAGLAPSLWLLDDFESELDSENALLLWSRIGDCGGQRWLTRVASQPDPGLFGRQSERMLFHVEHGHIRVID